MEIIKQLIEEGKITLESLIEYIESNSDKIVIEESYLDYLEDIVRNHPG